MSNNATAWYLVHCKPRQENRAQENLENQLINSFFPTFSLEKIIRGKRCPVEEALFPGYLFVELPINGELWSKIRSTRGVRDFVKFAGIPAKISDELLQQLKVIDEEVVEKAESNTPKMGERIRITSGPFKDLEGVFEIADGEQRSIVLLNLLGKQSKLGVLNTEIEKV